MESVKKLTHIEHILKRPDSYVGPVSQTTESYWVLTGENTFQKENLTYSPGLLKIFDEILVNCVDRNSLHPKGVTSIAVSIESDSVTVENNGPLGGLSVVLNEKEAVYNPRTRLRTPSHIHQLRRQSEAVGRRQEWLWSQIS